MKMSNDLFQIYLTDNNNSNRYYLGTKGKNPLVFCGLNPSTATSEKSDQTITKVKSFANKYEYDSFIMINLYPKRSTKPSELPIKFEAELLKRNIANVSKLLNTYNRLDMLACWGNKIILRDYLRICALQIFSSFGSKFRNFFQLGSLTQKGNPRHPSRLTYDVKLNRFDFKTYILEN